MVHEHWVFEHATKYEHLFEGAEEDCYLCTPSNLRPCSLCKGEGAEYGRPDCRTCTKQARRKKIWTIIT